MLEVDLLRGGDWGGDGRSGKPASVANPRRRYRDGWVAGSVVATAVSLALTAWLALSTRARTAGLEEALRAALADSARGGALIDRMRMLEARRDSIAARVSIIQEIDSQRYLWPRIMDEVAGVLPAEAWLTRIAQVHSPDSAVTRFEVEGMARDNFSLTRFWKGMESSPFIRNVRLVSTENVAAGPARGADGDPYYFVLRAEPEAPPPEMLEFVPVGAGAAGSPRTRSPRHWNGAASAPDRGADPITL